MEKSLSKHQSSEALFKYDIQKRIQCGAICGIDEAGRGPFAGDVYAAAVILDDNVRIDGLNDSKKLTEKTRERLFDEIKEKARAWCIATATAAEIDELNILNATMLAMKRAYEGLSVKVGTALVDGISTPDIDAEVECVIKGDGTSASIAAASVLAKVARDRYMKEISLKYPEYCFDKHKGYGTKLHYEMLDKFGASEIHRKSFLKKYYAQKENSDG